MRQREIFGSLKKADYFVQGVPATLCASIILINPIAKLALTMEPVAAAATSAVTTRTQGKLQSSGYHIKEQHSPQDKQGRLQAYYSLPRLFGKTDSMLIRKCAAARV